MSQQGTEASPFGGHTRSRQPTAHHHQAAKAILTVLSPRVHLTSRGKFGMLEAPTPATGIGASAPAGQVPSAPRGPGAHPGAAHRPSSSAQAPGTVLRVTSQLGQVLFWASGSRTWPNGVSPRKFSLMK
jgi:hypothetical protein